VRVAYLNVENVCWHFIVLKVKAQILRVVTASSISMQIVLIHVFGITCSALKSYR